MTAILNALLENSEGPVFCVDHEYRYLAYNSAHAAVMKAIYGVDIQIGVSLADYQTVPEDWQAAKRNLDRTLQGETVVESAYSGDAGRSRRYFEVSHKPVRSETGEINGVLVSAKEITVRVRADEAIAKMQDLLNETQRITKVGGWEYDVNTGQGMWTDEVYRIYGVPRDCDATTLARAMEFYAPDDRMRIAEAFTQAVEKGTPYDLELKFVNAKSEKLWVRTIGHAEHKDGKVVRVFGNIMDITERKQADAAKARLEEQFRGAQRMESVGLLAGGIAHDFNNLLSVILCCTEFAMTRAREDDRIRDELVEVKKAGSLAADLTRQLLAFSRKQILQPVVLNVNHVAVGIQKMLHRILGEDIEYVQVLAPDLGMVWADPGQIEQVLMNLVVNARDAMPGGGKLTIETSNVVLDEDYAAHHVAVKPGAYVHLAVTDTGCGMDDATKARIFEPFFTTKGIGKGTGLGLSTVYGIVKQSGGNIWVYSEPGRGSTFRIYLPRTRSLASTDLPLKSVVPDVGGTETILIVEDSEAIRGITSRILESAGYTVLVSASASEALATCHAHANIDLLLTDVVMPGMGGLVLAEQVVAFRPGIKVLYMSGYTDETIGHHGAFPPGTHFIAKPFSATALTRKVREALEGDHGSLHEGQESSTDADPGIDASPLDKDAVLTLGPEIRDKLRNAAKAAKFHEALELVDGIRSSNPDLAAGLRRLVLAYDYDALLDLL